MSQLSVTDEPQELCDLFFNDSNQAIVIVNASNQKIIHVNDALLELTKLTEPDLIGQYWHALDKPINQKYYNDYIKEISSNESVSFIIEHHANGAVNNINANFHMGVLEGEIVYLGYLISENNQGISNSTKLVHFKIKFHQSLRIIGKNRY